MEYEYLIFKATNIKKKEGAMIYTFFSDKGKNSAWTEITVDTLFCFFTKILRTAYNWDDLFLAQIFAETAKGMY